MLTGLILSLALAAQTAPAPPPATAAPSPPRPTFAPPPPPPPLPVPVDAVDTRPYVALVTDVGTIVVRLENKRAPVTAGNFLRYVDAKRMDGFKFIVRPKAGGRRTN